MAKKKRKKLSGLQKRAADLKVLQRAYDRLAKARKGARIEQDRLNSVKAMSKPKKPGE